jgi:hypothetical protein
MPVATRDRREPRLFRCRRHRLAAASRRGGRHRRVPHWDHRLGEKEKGLVSPTRLALLIGRELAGSFSPDGEQIVFRIESGDTYSLAVIDRDRGNLRRLTTGTGKPRFIDRGTRP